MINAEVNKIGTENVLSTIRKFTTRVRGTGLVKTVRAERYYSRAESKVVKKKHALKLIKRRAEYRQLLKEGKVVEAPARRTQYNREPSTAKPPDNTPPNTR
jgi:hypothetical protein